MANEKNRRHKRNKAKKEMAFINTKASFIAGIVVIITVINDVVGLIITIPFWVDLIEAIVCILLLFLFIGTKKYDNLLKTKGVEKFGDFLTVIGSFIFLLEKGALSVASKEELELSIYNDKLSILIVFVVFGIAIIVGSFSLLIHEYPDE